MTSGASAPEAAVTGTLWVGDAGHVVSLVVVACDGDVLVLLLLLLLLLLVFVLVLCSWRLLLLLFLPQLWCASCYDYLHGSI